MKRITLAIMAVAMLLSGNIANAQGKWGADSAECIKYLSVGSLLQQSRFISEHFEDFAGLSDKLVNINYSFLGLNLGDMPKLKFWVNGVSWATIGLMLIPVVSALLSWLQTKLSQAMNPQSTAKNDQTAQQMQTMNMTKPKGSTLVWIKRLRPLGRCTCCGVLPSRVCSIFGSLTKAARTGVATAATAVERKRAK